VLQRYFKILVIILTLQLKVVSAQKLYVLNWIPDSSSKAWFSKLVKSDYTPLDSLSCVQEIRKTFLQLIDASYLTANINNVNFIDSSCNVNITLGSNYKWVSLTPGNLPEDVLTAAGWRANQFYNQPYNHNQLGLRMSKMLQYLEQNGYPFAQLKLDSILLTNTNISAQLNLNKGDLIRFDTLEIIGDANIKSWYVAKYLGLKKDGLYNELLIKNANMRLSQLPYVQTTQPMFVYFVGAVAKPVVYLTTKKSSSVDGIVGFAPASNNNSNKLLITGEANLKLQNLFGTGKAFDLAFKSFLNGSQELRTRLVWPYILKSNIGVDYEFNLLKFDSSFLDVKHDIGLQYRFIGNDYFKVFYSTQSTSLITVDTLLIKQTKALPKANDITTNLYGIALKITRYDYFYNPRKGYSIDASAAVGVKNIERNSTINNLKFPSADGTLKSIYDTIQLSSVQYRLVAKGDVFIPITTRSTLRIETAAGHLQAQQVFLSEMFRIGGIRTLKGFDEQAIFASTYGIINTELRYLLQQNSNVMLFWNGAWYTNKLQSVSDKPYGFGAGLNFETGAGVFSLYYAVGKQFNNAIEFNKAKIHFGFVNYF
jgi:hypothetical protein